MVAARRTGLRNDAEQSQASRNHDDQPATYSPESVRPVHARQYAPCRATLHLLSPRYDAQC